MPRQEQVVPQGQQGQRAGGHAAEIAGRIHRDAERGAAQQHQEEGGQGIQAQVEGQVGQADGQDDGGGRQQQAGHADAGDDQSAPSAPSGNTSRLSSCGDSLQQQGREAQRQPEQHDAPGPVDRIGRMQGKDSIMLVVSLSCSVIDRSTCGPAPDMLHHAAGLIAQNRSSAASSPSCS